MEYFCSRQFIVSQQIRQTQRSMTLFDQEGRCIVTVKIILCLVLTVYTIAHIHYRGYDIRIGDNCGPLVPVTRDSLSYRLAEELTAGMKRKKYANTSTLLIVVPMYQYVILCRLDRSQLSFTPRGETSQRESKYFVRYFRQKVQTQYPWKGNKR